MTKRKEDQAAVSDARDYGVMATPVTQAEVMNGRLRAERNWAPAPRHAALESFAGPDCRGRGARSQRQAENGRDQRTKGHARPNVCMP
jgi:hypothetical protein